MCGICGVITFSDRPIDPGLVEEMTTTLRHRGPDGRGHFDGDYVALGHTRLSIVDLEGGSQPITNEDESVVVTFNGEIYNYRDLRKDLEDRGHRFRTRSDTEVLVHGYEEWGVDFVSRLNGIFAFAILDESRERLLLARDHLGVKPLYYYESASGLVFASEIKALLCDRRVPRQVDLEALGDLFTFRYVPSPKTLFLGIKKLPPAHSLIVERRGHTSIQRYWNVRPRIRQSSDERELVDTYRSLVESSVKLQLQSDVPVGLFLSSGVDSGVLLALMNEMGGRRVSTFTIGFSDGGEETNETADARKFAEEVGTEHSEWIVGPKEYTDYYERYLWDLEEPVGNETAAAFYFVSRLASQKVKVVLTGQGADEPWAGYHRHLGAKMSQYYSKLPRFLTNGVRAASKRLPRNERLKRGAASLAERDGLTRLTRIYSFFTPEMKFSLFKPWLVKELGGDFDSSRKALRHLYSDVEDLDPLTQMLYIDTRASLPDDLLMVADKTAMVNSLEARVPFLDYRLVEFVETLPPSLKLRGLCGKYLHKKAAEKWLPKSFVYRKKKGFANPIHKWLRFQLKSYLEDCLLSSDADLHAYFDKSYIEYLVKAHNSGKESFLRQLYLLISFELWHRMFISARSSRF